MNANLELASTQELKQQSLLDHYNPDNCVYFSSPQHSLLAKAPFANLLDAGMRGLNQRVIESLRFANELGHKNAVVVGAIGFDAETKSCLRLSTNYDRAQWGEQNHWGIFARALPQENNGKDNNSSGLTEYSIRPFPSPETYIASVKDALTRFARGELEKVVLSRTLEITCDKTPDVRDLVKHLEARNPSGYTFAINLTDEQSAAAKRTLIGASPELLISRRGNRIVANPLAGSEPRSSDPHIDKARADRLLVSPKDRYEHALVIDAVAKALAPFCSELNVPAEPSLIHTPTLWHLSTFIEGELINPETSSLELALAMHPTPAVCGFPTDKARTAIAELEGYDRGLFTGMVGWCDSSGDGEWVVTIRCAEVAQPTQIEKGSIRLYAGAGVVAGSDPEKELRETGAKFHTMLNALGINERF